MLGNVVEAEQHARDAVALADKIYDDTNLEPAWAHAQLAQVLQQAARPAEALVETELAIAKISKIVGERSERYGEALRMKATILHDLDRNAESTTMFARACEILAFTSGEDSAQQAGCLADSAGVLRALERYPEALAKLDKSMPVLLKAFGDHHPQIAANLLERGALYFETGKLDLARQDFERALAIFHMSTIDPGQVAAGEWARPRHLEIRSRARQGPPHRSPREVRHRAARRRPQRDAVAEWLATDGHPKRAKRL